MSADWAISDERADMRAKIRILASSPAVLLATSSARLTRPAGHAQDVYPHSVLTRLTHRMAETH